MSEDYHDSSYSHEFRSYTQKPDDVGTRYLHYRQLVSLLEDAVALLERQHGWAPNKITQENILKLKITVDIIKTQIDVITGYRSGDYQLNYKIDKAHRSKE
jgi:hypothetical protein